MKKSSDIEEISGKISFGIIKDQVIATLYWSKKINPKAEVVSIDFPEPIYNQDKLIPYILRIKKQRKGVKLTKING